MENGFKYVLVLEGKDYSKHADRYGDYVTNVPFKESNFFMTFREAMEALVLKDVRSFEEMSEGVMNNTHHDIASIYSDEFKEPLLKIIRIAFNDAPDGSPAAGIYMDFGDRTTKDFERLTAFRLSSFSSYDPDSPFLLLGSYSYELGSGFKINLDQFITSWESSLQYYEFKEQYLPKEWKYQVKTVKNSLKGEWSQEIKTYHFRELSKAFRLFLNTDVNQMDREIAERSGKKSWIAEAIIQERSKKPLADFIVVKNPDTNERVPEPGIHLKFHVPIGEIEKSAAIDLSGLGNYDDNDKYLLLAEYLVEHEDVINDYLNYTALQPLHGYTDLLASINGEPLQARGEKQESSFLLKVIWEKVQFPDTSSDVFGSQTIQETPFNSLDDGLAALMKLEERFFDQQTPRDLPYPFFIKRADIIDTSKNSVIVSKYQKTSETGKGMYMSFDNNDEALGLLLALDLLFKKRSAGEPDNTTLQRKRATADRTIKPPVAGGQKL